MHDVFPLSESHAWQKEALHIKEFEYENDEIQEAEVVEDKTGKRIKKKHSAMRTVAILLCIVLFFELLYCFLVFTDISAISNLRERFIMTALETNSHQWLAEAFFPAYMVDEIKMKRDASKNADDRESVRPKPTESVDPSETESTEPSSEAVSTTEPDEDAAEEAFYELYWELNRTSFEEYLEEHPDVLANGWDNIYINEAGLNDDGTSIYTSMGEQVLAIDVPNKLLLVRVTGTGYLGVLAIGKDPAQLRCEASAGIGSYGQSMEKLVSSNGGVLGMSASGFYDPNGAGTGGIIAGYAMCEGKGYGEHYYQSGYKRIELTADNKMYIIDSYKEVASDVTDAVEFSPALIVDGELSVGGFYQWNGINPRACIGQSERGEILMLVVEGRQIGRSIGTDVETCANILMKHDAYTAMNLDGGTSAVMWYNGEYVTKCSNTAIESRSLPNAWVYGNYE